MSKQLFFILAASLVLPLSALAPAGAQLALRPPAFLSCELSLTALGNDGPNAARLFPKTRSTVGLRIDGDAKSLWQDNIKRNAAFSADAITWVVQLPTPEHDTYKLSPTLLTLQLGVEIPMNTAQYQGQCRKVNP